MALTAAHGLNPVALPKLGTPIEAPHSFVAICPLFKKVCGEMNVVGPRDGHELLGQVGLRSLRTQIGAKCSYDLHPAPTDDTPCVDALARDGYVVLVSAAEHPHKPNNGLLNRIHDVNAKGIRTSFVVSPAALTDTDTAFTVKKPGHPRQFGRGGVDGHWLEVIAGADAKGWPQVRKPTPAVKFVMRVAKLPCMALRSTRLYQALHTAIVSQGAAAWH